MFVNKAIITLNSLHARPSSREAARNIPGGGGETLAPVFTHKTNEFILSTKNYAIVKRDPKLFK